MTELALAPIKARHEKATQGAWVSGDNELAVVHEACDGAGCEFCCDQGMYPLVNHIGAFHSCDDAEFCAEAHNDVPALVAEVERLRTELSKSDKALRLCKMDRAYLFGDLDDMRAMIPHGDLNK